MTCQAVIDWVDELAPNQYTEEQKYKWLTDCDSSIFRDVICTHEGAAIENFTGYIPDRDADTELIASNHPKLYRWYLQAQIDLANQEYTKYNNSCTTYNQAYKEFADVYNRTHAPLQISAFRFTSRRY